MSLGKIDSLRCKTHVKNGILKIVRGVLVVMKAEKIAVNLFMLKRKHYKKLMHVSLQPTREKSQ